MQQFLDIPAVLTSDNFVLDEKKHFFCFRKNAKTSCLNDNKGKTRSEGGPKFSEEFTKEADAFFETYNKELFAVFKKFAKVNKNATQIRVKIFDRFFLQF